MNKIEPPVFSLLPAHPIPTYALMRTKFYLPRTSNDIVPRCRLLERLNTGLGMATPEDEWNGETPASSII
jgi:hypothetical protein